LIAVGGIAFDYARLAAMDSELQNAADQAALAAVTQLDGRAGACSRASGTAVSFVTNQARMANDGIAPAVTITGETACDSTGKIRFWQNRAKTQPATNDANARFVEITVNARTAEYILTPVVGAFSSGAIDATAMAGLGSAICRVPPVMMCNPDEPLGNTNVNLDFNVSSRIGYGMKLIGDGSYAPGAFGFLETGFGNGASDLLQAIGHTVPPGDCAAVDGVKVKGGMNGNVFDGFNTRFDINANGNSCPGGDTNCRPSINVRKDLVRGNQCGITGQGWKQNPANNGNYATRLYRPTTVALLPAGTAIDIMGFPRDVCHAVGESASCAAYGGTARIGNGTWDRDVYFKSNYNWTPAQWQANTGLSPTASPSDSNFASRYNIYKWEYSNPSYAGVGANKGSININQPAQGSNTAYSTPQASTCLAPGITPGGTNVDRRRISAAVLNCQAYGVSGGGNTVYPVLRWIELFLVEPSISRTRCDGGAGGCNTQYTNKTDVYVEIIGETRAGGSGATSGQVVRRDTPYLVE
jgi:Flp pilus assembly protein TadG